MNPAFTAQLRAQPDKAWTPEEEIAFLLDATPPFAPGAGWEYSDTNYIVLGMVMETVTRTRAYDEIRQRFLTPLQLAGVVPVTGRRVPGLIPGYAGSRDPLGLPDAVLQNGVFVINPQFEWAGGGFATTARDLARWGQALYAGAALSAKARALMIDAAVPARLGPETRYGLGVIVRGTTPVGPTWGHSGFFPGYQAELVHVRDTGMTIALQMNSSAPRTQGSRSPLRFIYDVVTGTGELSTISASRVPGVRRSRRDPAASGRRRPDAGGIAVDSDRGFADGFAAGADAGRGPRTRRR
jgi:D-alanyl-D-alanine carboxypeptidase